MSVLLITSLVPNLNQLLPGLIGQYGSWIYVGLFALIFIETGIVILPFYQVIRYCSYVVHLPQ